MIRDRGSLKWTSMMLPEHVKALREWDYHTKHDQEKPEISDHQLDRMNFSVWKSVKFNQNVKALFYDTKVKQHKEIIGKIIPIPGFTDRINIQTDQEKVMLFIADILDLDWC